MKKAKQTQSIALFIQETSTIDEGRCKLQPTLGTEKRLSKRGDTLEMETWTSKI